MFELKKLMLVALCVVATRACAMLPSPKMDIVDNAPVEYTPEQLEVMRAQVQKQETANKKRKLALERGFPNLQTSEQADYFSELATNSCNQEMATRAHKRAEQLRRREAGVPNLAPRRLVFPDSDEE